MSTFKVHTVEFYVNRVKHTFEIKHNLPDTLGLSFNDAVHNWIHRTDVFTAKSLCKYINGKNTGYHAKPYKNEKT